LGRREVGVLAEREENRCRKRLQLGNAFGVRDHGWGEVGVQGEERSERARRGRELSVQERHELLAHLRIGDEPPDLELVEPAEFVR
jgi:hypothetical protein